MRMAVAARWTFLMVMVLACGCAARSPAELDRDYELMITREKGGGR